MKRITVPLIGLCWLLIVLETVSTRAESAPMAQTTVQSILDREAYQELKPYGAATIEPLLTLYQAGNVETRRRVANALYSLSIESDQARKVLMQDVHTPDQQLRLAVQWALGRVSNDADVVRTLLDNMQHDPNPLFRDKAACALAYDQVHLTEFQRLLLFEGLVHALEDDKEDVRHIALLALQIHTGQTKGFQPQASLSVRQLGVQQWQAWVAEYRANLAGE
jgi:HEAT repeat protein